MMNKVEQLSLANIITSIRIIQLVLSPPNHDAVLFHR